MVPRESSVEKSELECQWMNTGSECIQMWLTWHVIKKCLEEREPAKGSKQATLLSTTSEVRHDLAFGNEKNTSQTTGRERIKCRGEKEWRKKVIQLMTRTNPIIALFKYDRPETVAGERKEVERHTQDEGLKRTTRKKFLFSSLFASKMRKAPHSVFSFQIFSYNFEYTTFWYQSCKYIFHTILCVRHIRRQ